MYLNLGYAIVATDYVGLETTFRNASVDMRSNATDVIYSVLAARHAVPELSPRWVAVGSGEGGAATVLLDELEEVMHDDGYLGSVSIGGRLDLRAVIQQISSNEWRDSIAFLFSHSYM
jgi:hypothetical protein